MSPNTSINNDNNNVGIDTDNQANAESGAPSIGGPAGRFVAAGRSGAPPSSRHATGSSQRPRGPGCQRGPGALHRVSSGRVEKERLRGAKYAVRDVEDMNPSGVANPQLEIASPNPPIERENRSNSADIRNKVFEVSGTYLDISRSLAFFQHLLKCSDDDTRRKLVVTNDKTSQPDNSQPTCANCREVGHTLRMCVRASTQPWHRIRFAGAVCGCPQCNELHNVDTCSVYQALGPSEKGTPHDRVSARQAADIHQELYL